MIIEKPKGVDLSQFVEKEDYFGFEESIIEPSKDHKLQSQFEDKDMGDSINLSEYLDKAYDKFDPNYKVRFEDDEDFDL